MNIKNFGIAAVFSIASTTIQAHPLGSDENEFHHLPLTRLAGSLMARANTKTNLSREKSKAPQAALPFQKFAPLVQTRFDQNFLYVESNSMPDHPMMVGITAWQQQVPLPQTYSGDNAWRIPLHPVVAKNPLSAKSNFFRGAIALAANGVPIFNPIKNDGRTDTFLAGELDEYGGHSGRGDDYHYHIAPLHLQETLGEMLPVAYALDGYPIYGLNEPDGSAPGKLDAFNGHIGPDGDYHYHSTKTYPYLNGGFHGEVVQKDGQVDPQPRAEGVRPATRPLRGAKIIGWNQPDSQSYSVEYTLGRRSHFVNYTLLPEGGARFEFVDDKGQVTTETYDGKSARGSGGGGNRENRERPPRGDRDRPRAESEERSPRGPDPNDPNRQPWIKVHAKEMDTNGDGTLTREELVAEVEKTLAGYDANNDGAIQAKEYQGRGGSRSALGGFVKQHSQELDQNGDTTITKDELLAVPLRMFQKADANNDRKATAEEFAQMRSPQTKKGREDRTGPPKQ